MKYLLIILFAIVQIYCCNGKFKHKFSNKRSIEINDADLERQYQSQRSGELNFAHKLNGFDQTREFKASFTDDNFRDSGYIKKPLEQPEQTLITYDYHRDQWREKQQQWQRSNDAKVIKLFEVRLPYKSPISNNNLDNNSEVNKNHENKIEYYDPALTNSKASTVYSVVTPLVKETPTTPTRNIDLIYQMSLLPKKRLRRNIPNNLFLQEQISQNSSPTKRQASTNGNPNNLFAHNPFLRNITIPSQSMINKDMKHNPWLQNVTRKPAKPKDPIQKPNTQDATSNTFITNVTNQNSSVPHNSSVNIENNKTTTSKPNTKATSSSTLNPKLSQLIKMGSVLYPDSPYLSSTTTSSPQLLDIKRR